MQYAEAMLADEYARTGVKQRLIDEFVYAADSWDIERRVITRLEHGSQGNNPRFVVTNLQGDAIQLYERLYCARGEAENRIKEAQLDLFGTRASCHRFAANQLRLLLAALAYTLMQRLQRTCPQGQRVGARRRGHDPGAAAEDRRRHRAQYAPRARAAVFSSPAAQRVPQRSPGAGPLNPIQCCPRHADKRWGKGGGVPKNSPEIIQHVASTPKQTSTIHNCDQGTRCPRREPSTAR